MAARNRTVYAVKASDGKLLALVSTWESRMAINHVAQRTMSAARATQQEMYEAGRQGIEVQSTPSIEVETTPPASRAEGEPMDPAEA